MTIGIRIKQLRKVLGLTQQEFADKIKVSRSNIATYEVGKNNPAEAVTNLICREFNVSGPWLRTGEGEMFVAKSREDELADFVSDLLRSRPDDIRRRFVAAISKLSTQELEILERAALHLVEYSNVPAELPATEQSQTDEQTAEPEDIDIEAEVEAYRQELLAEKQVRTSRASTYGSTG